MIAPTVEQLEQLPPELRPIAQRYGLDLLNFTLVVAGTNQAIDKLIRLGERYKVAQEPSMVILNNMSTLCEDILKSRGWNMDAVQECMQDVGRAQDLAGGTPKILIH